MTETNTSAVKRALISVSDKTGIVDFAQALVERGIELLSTGGTYRLLRDNAITVTEVSEYTGFPEMMDGRLAVGPGAGDEPTPEEGVRIDSISLSNSSIR